MTGEEQLLSGKTVLIVEDEAINRLYLRQLLGKSGARILEAGTGEAGLSLVLKEKPDLLLLDIGLPGMSGVEVAGEIRRREELQHLIIIAVTAHAHEEDLSTFLEGGMNGVVTKPFSSRMLFREIRRWV